MLHAVDFSTHESCLTYALKRVGLPTTLTYEDLVAENSKYFTQHIFKKQNLKVGDILIWNKDSYLSPRAWHLTKEGRFLARVQKSGYHVGVVEEKNIISHYQGEYPDFRVDFMCVHTLKNTPIVVRIKEPRPKRYISVRTKYKNPRT